METAEFPADANPTVRRHADGTVIVEFDTPEDSEAE